MCFRLTRKPGGATPLIQRTQRTVVRQGKSYKIQPKEREINISMQVFIKKHRSLFAFLHFFCIIHLKEGKSDISYNLAGYAAALCIFNRRQTP